MKQKIIEDIKGGEVAQFLERLVRRAADAGLSPRCGQGFFTHGQLSLPTLSSGFPTPPPPPHPYAAACLNIFVPHVKNTQHCEPCHCLDDTTMQHTPSRSPKMEWGCPLAGKLKTITYTSRLPTKFLLPPLKEARARKHIRRCNMTFFLFLFFLFLGGWGLLLVGFCVWVCCCCCSGVVCLFVCF